MLYRLFFTFFYLLAFSRVGFSATLHMEEFPAAVEMNPRKLHQIVNVVRDPLPVDGTSRVQSGSLQAEIISIDERTVCVKCAQVGMSVIPFCMETSVDFLHLRGKAHGGLVRVVRNSVTDFQRVLREFMLGKDAAQTEFIFTGYSSGASIASLLAADFVKHMGNYGVSELKANQVKIIGFETQRIGDKEFRDHFLTSCIPDHNIINFWHAEDVHRHNIFFSKDWRSSAKKPVDLGKVLISARKSEFVGSSSSDAYSYSKLLKFASVSVLLYAAYKSPEYFIGTLRLIHDYLPCVVDGISSGFSETRASIMTSIRNATLYQNCIKAVCGFGILGVVGEFFFKKPSMPYMFHSFLMSKTIQKYQEKDGYFSFSHDS